MTEQRFWLLKAEPNSRIIKGHDVKFSVDDFASIGTTSWDGVRNYQARNYMRSMQIGDQALFYHSNCESPGIAAFAEVAKEVYPDHTSWDKDHPYYDPKCIEGTDRWSMVDLKFKSQTQNFVELHVLKSIAATSSTSERMGGTLSSNQIKAIQEMPLLSSSRLSVQPVSKEAFDVITILAQTGDWEGDQGLEPSVAIPKAKKRKREEGDGDGAITSSASKTRKSSRIKASKG